MIKDENYYRGLLQEHLSRTFGIFTGLMLAFMYGLYPSKDANSLNTQPSKLAGYSWKLTIFCLKISKNNDGSTIFYLQIKLIKKLILPKKKSIKAVFKNASGVLSQLG